MFAQKVYQLDNMHSVINRCIYEGTKNVIAQMRRERKDLLQLPEPDNMELIGYPDDNSIIFEVDEEFEKTMKQKTGDFLTTGIGFGVNKGLANIDIKRTTMNITKPALKPPMMPEVEEEVHTPTNAAQAEEKASSGLSKLQDSDAETEIVAIPNPMMNDVDKTNAISPTKLTVAQVKKTIFPDNFTQVNEFEPVNLRNSYDYDNPPVRDKAKEKFANRARIMPMSNALAHSS